MDDTPKHKKVMIHYKEVEGRRRNHIGIIEVPAPHRETMPRLLYTANRQGQREGGRGRGGEEGGRGSPYAMNTSN